MRVSSLRALVMAGVPLIAAAPAAAVFTGLDVASKPNEFGLRVCNVYAVFDSVDDSIITVGTDVVSIVTVINGTFFQHPAGNDFAPNPAIFAFLPELRYDTFVTIGVKSYNPNDPGSPEGQPEDHIVVTPSWPGFQPAALVLDNAAYGVANASAQGEPFNPAFVAGDGRVLIGQFSTLDGDGFQGSLWIYWVDDLGGHTTLAEFICVPAPGAGVLAGAAAAAGAWTRRRRRGERRQA